MSLFSDNYYEIEQASEFNMRDKGSKFMAYSFPVHSESEVKPFLQQLKSKYPDATHHCYAYVIGQSSEAQRANDDGEPSNSAGRPILRAIISQELTNVLVVVVRYFGGTLLGIPGLIAAYGGAAQEVLKISGKVERIQEERFNISTDFDKEQEIHLFIKPYEFRIINREYTDRVTYTVMIRKNQVMQFEKAGAEAYLLEVKSS